MRVETVMTREEWNRRYREQCAREIFVRIMNFFKGTLLLLFLVFALGFAGKSDFEVETHVVPEEVVLRGEVHFFNGKQYVATSDGQVHGFCDDRFEHGDKVRVKFDTKETETKKDDEIINMRHRLF